MQQFIPFHKIEKACCEYSQHAFLFCREVKVFYARVLLARGFIKDEKIMSEYSQAQKPLYETVLVALENSARDKTILSRIEPLVKLCGGHISLAHVADGWAARN